MELRYQKHNDHRPIPQGQIDLMGNSEAEKDAYQNPGYQDLKLIG